MDPANPVFVILEDYNLDIDYKLLMFRRAEFGALSLMPTNAVVLIYHKKCRHMRKSQDSRRSK